ncbi:universal stress protein [Mucilaginibacter sp. X4EP1]|jgi:nucleotide-binding universal stress UspA family protein|uniref:universal stress protein n=1 Tax=Mucilaginibacter sp. X4EP1 TaxID=2723092 RepID=UPI00216A2E5F|nr:universal stress protein [Mucilaginibacter sp. X4EP1]MCS3813034.1 nucleotide-binding universal stress UspA family protein [Mucilaginibacter sp. X4EP1]
MKTILVLTDFSINADYVAQYALKFARQIGANILLCNIYQAPAGDEITDRVSRPMQACAENSNNDLGAQVAQLKSRLEAEVSGSGFRPEINQYSVEGHLSDIVNQLTASHDLLMLVISAHSADKITEYFNNDHCWDVIDNAAIPVLVIPYQVRFKPFRIIAFGSVMNYTDLNILESLAGLSRYSNAEIIVTNIIPEKELGNEVKEFFNQIPGKINYPHIVYHSIVGKNTANSLHEFCAHIDVDLLAMVHQKDSFFDKLFGGSITRKMAKKPEKPILIFPGSTIKETLSVF